MNIYLSSDLGEYYSKELVYSFNKYVGDKFKTLINQQKVDQDGMLRSLNNKHRLPRYIAEKVTRIGKTREHLNVLNRSIFFGLSLADLKINWDSYLKYYWNLNDSTGRYLFNKEIDNIHQKLSDFHLDVFIDRIWSYIIEGKNQDDPVTQINLEKDIRYSIDYQWSIDNKKLIAIKLLIDFLQHLDRYLLKVRQSLYELSDYIHYYDNLNDRGVIHCLTQIPIQYQKHIPSDYLLE